MLLLIICLLINYVQGHGYLSNPPAIFYDNKIKTSYNGIITEDSDPAFAGLKWNDNPTNNLKTFTESFKKSKFKSLKDMFDHSNIDCGNTRIDVNPVDINGMTTMSWQNDEYREGFTPSHSGPCEVWLNDTMVMQNDDCRSKYTKYPAVIDIDYSSCGKYCLFEFYWIAVHEPNWQAYKQCVPLTNSKAINISPSPSIKYTISINGSTCFCSIV